jgi:hypothetical protein
MERVVFAWLRDREGASATTQHKIVARPNEVAHQGCCRDTATACDCVGLHTGNRCAPWRNVVEIRNERRSSGRATSVHRLGEA